MRTRSVLNSNVIDRMDLNACRTFDRGGGRMG